jgi:hypothetical protein
MATNATSQAAQTIGIGGSGVDSDRRARLVEEVEVQTLATEV